MSPTPNQPDDLLAQVTGMAPEVAEHFSQTEGLFETPTFTFEVVTKSKLPGAAAMNGHVVMKYPNFGDDLKIERAAALLGGGNLAQMKATLLVCITKAPKSWYVLDERNTQGILDLDRLPDDAVLADLFLAFTDWQRSFR